MSNEPSKAWSRDEAREAAYALYDGEEQVAVMRNVFLIFLDQIEELVDAPLNIERQQIPSGESYYLVSLAEEE